MTGQVLRITAPDDERTVIKVDGRQVARANYDEHGSAGMELMVSTAMAVARAAGMKIEDQR